MRKKYPKLFEQSGMKCEAFLILRMKLILWRENVKTQQKIVLIFFIGFK
jgi:hypothetical protein